MFCSSIFFNLLYLDIPTFYYSIFHDLLIYFPFLGFLAAHLIGQHPEIFKVACMRNPVTDIPGMLSVTDIPGWTDSIFPGSIFFFYFFFCIF